MSKNWSTIVLLALLTSSGCVSLDMNPKNWQLPTMTSEAAPPGTPEWWKKSQKQAEFVLGEGWRVPGVDGYFDDEGRPIRAQVAKIVHRDDSKKGLLEDPQVSKRVAKFKEQFGMGPDQQLAQQVFAEGETLFRGQKYSQSAKKFKEAAKRWPESQLEQDAFFYRAESEYFDKQYSDAIDTYSALLKKYPNTPHLDEVVQRQFDIARYWEKHHQYKPHWATTPNLLDETRPLFDTLGRAIKTYDDIRLNDPTGPLADDAIMATANSYFLRGRYNDADYQYELLRNEYPRSEHQFEAHILGLQCKLRKYQGPDYDDTSLREAKKLVKQLKVQFSGELNAEERARLSDIQAQLNQQLAERDYKMAKFYDDTEHFGSAKFYYGQLIRDYPGTPLAIQARERFVELGGKPDHPPTKLEWLVDVFPENSERKAIAQVPMIAPNEQPRVATQPSEGGPADGNTILR